MIDYVKADLRNFTSFFSPDKYKTPPTLFDLAKNWQQKGLGIVSLTAAHSATGKIDQRFQHYLNQANSSEGEYATQIHEGGRYITVFRQFDEISPALVILNSQQVRAYLGKDPVEVNILGIRSIVLPTRPLADVLKEGRDTGGIVLLSHMGTRNGVPLEIAVDLFREGKVDGVEIGAYVPKIQQSHLNLFFDFGGIHAVPTSGGHSYKQAGKSYIDIPSDKLNHCLIDSLREVVKTGSFKPHFGHIGFWSRAWNRDRHIIAGIPENFLANKTRREENARVLGLKK